MSYAVKLIANEVDISIMHIHVHVLANLLLDLNVYDAIKILICLGVGLLILNHKLCFGRTMLKLVEGPSRCMWMSMEMFSLLNLEMKRCVSVLPAISLFAVLEI